MKKIFLDTNPIIRYLTQDNQEQAAASYKLFKKAAGGEFKLITSESVLVEVVRVLSSKVLYHLPRQEVRKHLGNLLALKGLVVPYKRTFLKALDLWSNSKIDFVDTLCIAQMERLKISVISSFDNDFDHFSNITRQNPSQLS